MGYNCCFFLNFVPLHIETPYNFGGTGPILGLKNPLQRVNGHADITLNYVMKLSATCGRSMISSTNKTGHHDITEISFKVTQNSNRSVVPLLEFMSYV